MGMHDGFNREKKRTGSIDIEALKASLRQLQPTRRPAKINVLRDLLDVVDQLHDDGVSYADIAAHLTEKTKIEFKEGALKSMLSKLRKEANAAAESGDSGTSQDGNVSNTSHRG